MRDLHCAQARYVWNLCVEQESWWRRDRGKMPTWVERCRQLAEARTEFEWLRAGSNAVQQQAIRDFGRAMTAFLDPKNPAREPTFRKAVRDEGFRIVGERSGPHVSWGLRRLNRNWGEVRIPKVGWVRFRWSRPVPGDVKSFRVTLDRAGRWHVSFPSPQGAVGRRPTGAAVGIDRGVRTALVTSEGQHFRVPRIGDRAAGRYVALQRRMSRQQKGSRKREKTRLAMARIAVRVADRRKDWAEKVSTRLVSDYDLIVFEKLNVVRMTRKSAPKSDPDQVGAFLPNKARAKAGLNRGILAACWGILAARAEEKAVASGVSVIYVNPRFTSQQCHACGHVSRKNRESQAVFRCESCGHHDHADANAAKNVLARGLGTMAVPAHAPGHGVQRPHKSARAAAGTTRSAT
jgi:transposase